MRRLPATLRLADSPALRHPAAQPNPIDKLNTHNKVTILNQDLTYEDRLGGEYSPDHDHIWLNWNSESEFYYEPPPANRPDFDRGNRKFIRAILLKNGLTVAESRDK